MRSPERCAARVGDRALGRRELQRAAGQIGEHAQEKRALSAHDEHEGRLPSDTHVPLGGCEREQVLTSESSCATARAGAAGEVQHRFKCIYPFVDTNGRTGRVLDHYLLWGTFDLVGPDSASARAIEYFPDEPAEHAYHEGLAEAENHRPAMLREYYFRQAIARLRVVMTRSQRLPAVDRR